MGKETFLKYESEVRSYCRSFPEIFNYAKGSIIRDVNGKEYIDFFCGAGALNYGHNNDKIKKKLMDYLESDGIIHALDMYTEKKDEFIAYFEKEILKKKGLDYKIQFTGPTGTNGVEAALKLARKVTKRQGVFALMGAFHGMTLASLALTSDRDSRRGAGVPLDHVTHIPAPYMFEGLDTLNYLETILSDDHSGVDIPAAIVIETVQAEGGIYVFDPEWIRGIREICDRYKILLIVDDVQVGSCRTGPFFSFEKAGIVPDMVVLSKSIGGYGLPFALTLLKPEIDVWAPGEHNGTFRGNQLSFVAAKAGLEIMIEEKVEEQVAQKEKLVRAFLEEKIASIDPKIGIRGTGLIWGIDFASFADKDLSKKVVAECFQNGLIVEKVGRKNGVVKVMPPLVIEKEQLIEGLEILEHSIKTVLS